MIAGRRTRGAIMPFVLGVFAAGACVGFGPGTGAAGADGVDLCGRISEAALANALGDGVATTNHQPGACRWFGGREGRYVAVSVDGDDAAGRLESLLVLPGAMAIAGLGERAVALDAGSECGCSQVGGIALYVLADGRLFYVSVPDGGDSPGTLRNARAIAAAALAAERTR